MSSLPMDFDGIDGPGYLRLASAKAAAQCPHWCDNDHDDPEDSPHYSAMTSIDMLWEGSAPAVGRRDFLQVGLDQPHIGDDTLMVTVATSRGDIWLTLPDVQRLMACLLRLDMAARGVCG